MIAASAPTSVFPSPVAICMTLPLRSSWAPRSWQSNGVSPIVRVEASRSVASMVAVSLSRSAVSKVLRRSASVSVAVWSPSVVAREISAVFFRREPVSFRSHVAIGVVLAT